MPSANVPTVTGALVCPAATVTAAGTETIPAGVALTATVVSVGWVEEIVTVSVVVAPSATGLAGGKSDTTVG